MRNINEEVIWFGRGVKWILDSSAGVRVASQNGASARERLADVVEFKFIVVSEIGFRLETLPDFIRSYNAKILLLRLAIRWLASLHKGRDKVLRLIIKSRLLKIEIFLAWHRSRRIFSLWLFQILALLASTTFWLLSGRYGKYLVLQELKRIRLTACFFSLTDLFFSLLFSLFQRTVKYENWELKESHLASI